jgi:hypothetical protein
MAVNCTVGAVLMEGAPWQRGALLREQEVAEEERRADAGPRYAAAVRPQESRMTPNGRCRHDQAARIRGGLRVPRHGSREDDR